MPKVSIITTTYKHQNFIAKTIESILSQSFTDWELLIGDDSPDDATWEIIQRYVEKYPDKIQAWHHNPSKRIADNMKFLIEKIHPQTEYVAFLEGDDMYTLDNLEKKLTVFATYPEVQLVYSDLSYIDSEGKVLVEGYLHRRGCKFYQNTKIPPIEYIEHIVGPIASWSTGMLRKGVLKDIQINKIYPMDAGDCDFYFNLSRQFPVYGILEPLTMYRRHSNNTSRIGKETLLTQRDTAILYMRDRMTEYTEQGYVPSKIAHQKISYTYISFAIFSLEHGLKQEAWDNLILAYKESFLYGLHYKLAIGFFILLPSFVGKYILKKLIKRGDK